jgi:hypothetical protein
MFCPVCEAEYKPGITTCADDGTQLVEQLTPENTLHDNSEARFLPLHNVGSPAEAEMVTDILTQNGVRVAVQSGGTRSRRCSRQPRPARLCSWTSATSTARRGFTSPSSATTRRRSRARRKRTKKKKKVMSDK